MEVNMFMLSVVYRMASLWVLSHEERPQRVLSAMDMAVNQIDWSGKN